VPNRALSEAIPRVESDKRLLDTARARLDTAHAMYHEAKTSADFAKMMLLEASEALDCVQKALAERGSATLTYQHSHGWDENLSAAENVSIIGLDSARTLAYGRCVCWNPESTLPNEVREHLESQKILIKRGSLATSSIVSCRSWNQSAHELKQADHA
jgi:hypothetical protein